ncbi:tetratricopeptide repeat protein [Pseudomonas sp. CNPSo 3701]|uniref:type III secretion apparatus assembly chaperone SctY n=1 Tax=Pseudomonas sp. CNPSo 3701 TaxID=3027943 RepID=UPI0023632BD4|nr:type III secretion protein [Pseudomonas sp. CNPSo 3701]MDD1510207.1 type III secretion protein [Pseudomonas sp. CNPSo 3701]
MTLRDDHDAAKLLQGLGDLYLRVGQGPRALVLLLLAVQLNPDDPVLLARLAAAFTANGDGERALHTLDRLRGLQGESVALLLLRSRALWSTGQHGEARACFARYRALRQERDA